MNRDWDCYSFEREIRHMQKLGHKGIQSLRIEIQDGERWEV